jgi:hypothetical protein
MSDGDRVKAIGLLSTYIAQIHAAELSLRNIDMYELQETLKDADFWRVDLPTVGIDQARIHLIGVGRLLTELAKRVEAMPATPVITRRKK